MGQYNIVVSVLLCTQLLHSPHVILIFTDNTKSHSGAMCELCYGAIGALIVLCLALALFIVYLHWKHSATPIQKVITIPGT